MKITLVRCYLLKYKLHSRGTGFPSDALFLCRGPMYIHFGVHWPPPACDSPSVPSFCGRATPDCVACPSAWLPLMFWQEHLRCAAVSFSVHHSTGAWWQDVSSLVVVPSVTWLGEHLPWCCWFSLGN